MGQVGILPLVTAGISIASSLIGSKKAEKKEREAYYQANQQAIASGQAISALSLMSETAKANLRRVWPWIREQGSFSSIDWNKLGLPNGPGLSAVAAQALGIVWPEVRAAARFDDVNWNNHAVPLQNVASSLPVPELPAYLQPSVPQQVMQAGIFPAGIPTDYVLAGGVGLALLIVLSQRR